MNNYGNTRRNIVLIIGFVVLLGLFQQFIRSQLIFNITNQTIDRLDEVSQQPAAAAAVPEGYKTDRMLIVYDSGDDTSVLLRDNVVQVLDYMKKRYDVAAVNELPEAIPDSYLTVVTTFSDWSLFPSMRVLEHYVEKGGHVFFAMRPEIDDALYGIYRKLGITSIGTAFTAKTVSFQSNVLLKSAGEEFNEDFLSNSVLALLVDPSCSVHATTGNDAPLLWDVDYGLGKFMVFNGTILQSRMNRGMIAGALSLLNREHNYIYPVLNMKLAYIDDFPAPFPEGSDPGLMAQYGRNNRRFFREVWWPDILKAAARYDVKYTGVLIETYNDQVKPPFSSGGSDNSSLILYGRELLKNGGEIGVHGYNHQSLETDPKKSAYLGYTPWSSFADMRTAMEEVKRFYSGVFPNYTLRTYVPPSNMLSEEGREAIKAAIPDMKIISSVYHEDHRNLAYVQEFGQAEDGIFELPRLTSGYEFSANTRWFIMNGVTSIGVFSHFIHPDDIYDTSRSGNKSWQELSGEYEDLLRFTNSRYGWLKPLTASGGAYELGKYIHAGVSFKQDDSHIEGFIDGFKNNMDFILRTEKKIGKLTNCSATLIDEDMYLIHAVKANFSLGLDG